MGTPREQGDLPVGMIGAADDTMFVGSPHRSHGYMYFSGVVVQDEFVTIGGRVYQFTATGVVTVATYVAVDVAAGLTAAIASAALVAAINGDTYAGVTAGLMTGDTVSLVGDDETNMALAEATTNVDLSAALMTNGAVDTQKVLAEDRYTMTTQDLAVLAVPGEVVIGSATFVGTPHLRGLIIMDINGDLKPVTATDVAAYWELVSGHLYRLVVTDNNTIFVLGDTIDWIGIG